MEKLRLQLRVVFYKEDGNWIAHCLEMDVMGHGTDKKSAIEMMMGAVCTQVAFSVANDNRANIFQPAESQLFNMYAAGKDIGNLEVWLGEMTHKKIDHLEIQDIEAREYQGALQAV